MTKITKTRQMCVRLRALGVPKQQANQIINLFVKWTNCSGPEWTVERLKALKLEYVSRLAGRPVLAAGVKRNKEGFPSGVWSWLFKWQSKNAPFKVLNTLMCYSTLTSKAITEKQRIKFFGSMESTDKTGLQSELGFIPQVRVPNLDKPLPFLVGCTQPSKSAPSCLGPSIRQDDSWGQFMFFTQSVACIAAYYRYPLVFEKVVPKPLTVLAFGSPKYHLDVPIDQAAVQAVGKLGFIQEPGYKLRAVANPNAVWQVALAPLKNLILRDLRDNFPTDCTHDQEAGVAAIQGWIAQGKTCFSVDLSDATNLFPRHLQMDVLRKRYLFTWKEERPDIEFRRSSDITTDVIETKRTVHRGSSENQERFLQLVDAFQFASEAPWYYKDEKDGKFKLAKFTRGQPLGLGPSFASFALAHNLLLIGICKKVGVAPADTFRILGDDIVISDYEVHRRYRATLANLGCKVSKAKTLVSSSTAEFGGRVITANAIIPTFKWRRVAGSNFLDIARNYGRESRRLLTPNQRLVVDSVAEIPEVLGGLGWNPYGKSLTDRMSTPVAHWLMDRTLSNLLVMQKHFSWLDGWNYDYHVNESGNFAIRQSNESAVLWGKQTLVPYRTLTSLWFDFERQAISSGLIPAYERSTLCQHLWAGDVGSTRSDLLRYWDNSMYRESMECLESKGANDPMIVRDITLTYITEEDDEPNYSPVFSKDNGWLIPMLAKPGDPRKAKSNALLRLGPALVDQYPGKNIKDINHRLLNAFSDHTRISSAPFFNGLLRVISSAVTDPVAKDYGHRPGYSVTDQVTPKGRSPMHR